MYFCTLRSKAIFGKFQTLDLAQIEAIVAEIEREKEIGMFWSGP